MKDVEIHLEGYRNIQTFPLCEFKSHSSQELHPRVLKDPVDSLTVNLTLQNPENGHELPGTKEGQILSASLKRRKGKDENSNNFSTWDSRADD